VELWEHESLKTKRRRLIRTLVERGVGNMNRDQELSSDYVESCGLECPECSSQEIIGGEFLADTSTVSRECHCEDCNSEWTEVFNLVGIDNIQRAVI